MVLDLDATLLTAHSEKEDATPTWKKTFGFHPLFGFVAHGLGGTGEPVGELLRRGKAGSNTPADHVTVFDTAVEQVPKRLPCPGEHGRRAILVRTNAAGATREVAAHPSACGVEFSLGANLGHIDVHAALKRLPDTAWTQAHQATKPTAPARPATARGSRRGVGRRGDRGQPVRSTSPSPAG